MAIGAEISKLFVRIGADISELKTGLAQAGSEVNKAASNIQNAGNKFSSAGRALTVGVTAPIIALGGFALKASIDFESAFAGVRKTVDATEPEFAQLRQGIRDMAKEMPLSASKIAEVAEAAGQLGVQKDDVLAFTKTMVKLGTATNLSATEAATGFARLANIMRVPLKDVDKLADVLVNLGNKGASTEKEIVDMALRIAGAAQQIGISAQDVLAFANALSSVGIEAEAGGSAISRTFIEIAEAVSGLAPTPEHLQEISDATRAVSDASDGLASAQRGVRDAGEGVASAQRGVRDALEGVTSAQQGVRDAMHGVLDAQRNSRNATEALRDAQANLTRAYRDQRQAQLDARRETLSVAEAYQGLREVQAQAGSQSLEYRAAQLAVAEAQKRVRDASKGSRLEQQQAALGLQQAQARLNQVMVQGPRYAIDLQNAQLRLAEAQARVGQSAQQNAEKIQQAQRQVRSSVEGVNDARRNEQKAAQGVADANRNLRNANEGVADANRNLRNSHEGVTDAQRNAVRASQDLSDAQKRLNELTDGSNSKLKLFAEVAGMSVEEFSNLFQKDAKSAVLAFVEGLGRIKESGGDVFGTLKKLGLEEVRQRDALLRLAGAGNVLRQSFEDAASASGALDREFKEKAETSAAQLAIKWNEITDSMIELGDALKPIFMELLAAAQPFFDAVRIGAEAFANLPGPVQKVIVGLALLAAIIGPLLIAIGAMASGIGAIIGVMGVLGISFAGGSIAVTGLAAAFGTLILAALPWIALAAALVVAGYLVYKNWDIIKAAAVSLGNTLTGAFNAVLSFLRTNWREVATLISGPFAPLVILATDAFGIRSAIVGALNAVVDFFRGLPGRILAAMGDVSNILYNAGRGIVNGMLRGISEKWGDLVKWLTNAVNKLPAPVRKALEALSPSKVFEEIGTDIVSGLALGIKPAADLVVPAPAMAAVAINPGGGNQEPYPVDASGRPVGDYVKSHQRGLPRLPQSAQGFITNAPMATGTHGAGFAEVRGAGGGDFARGEAATKNSGLNIEINGPVKVQNIGSRRDATGALGDLAFGVKGQLNRRGIYA